MKKFKVVPLKSEVLETLESNNLSPSSSSPEILSETKNCIRPVQTSNFLQVVQETVAQAKLAKQQETQEEYNFEAHGKQLLLAKTSLWIFSERNRFRKALVWFIESKWFDVGITIIIFLNTAFLALTDYETRIDPTKQSIRNDVVDIADLVFSSIFIVEFIIKVIAMGFVIGKGTYLRNGWNLIDIIVVITSIINIIPTIPNINSLRPIRVIKPLRSVNTIKGMKTLVSSLIDSLPALANVSIFLSFLIIVYSILGVQLFSGAFENRCRLTPEPVHGVWLAKPDYLDLCGTKECPVGTYCGSPATYDLPKNWDEIQVPELIYGIPNFDNIFNATLSVFQSVTTEGWSTNMYLYSHTYSPAIVMIYFCSLVVFGAFFALNLILAVITDTFHRSRTKEQKERKSLPSPDSFPSLQVKTVSNKHAPEISQVKKFDRSLSLRASPVKEGEKSGDDNGIILEDLTAQASTFQSIQRFKTMHGHISKKSGFSTDRSDKPIADKNVNKDKDKNEKGESIMQIFSIDEHLNQRTQNNKLYYHMHKIVASKIFLGGIVLLIIMNTVILALAKYPEDKDMNNILETMNSVLTFIFTAELCVKLLGLGFVEYSKDRFNLLDAVIVIISLVEFTTDTILGSSSGMTVVTAFRCFRLVRMFKLARSWTSLRNLLTLLGKTLKDIKNFTILLFLFVVISALLGLELFAYKAKQDDGQFPRINFNSFLEAMIAVFALLTGEAWNLIMYTHFRTAGKASAIYFVIVVLVGNYILLKLFLAILINNFQGLQISKTHSSHSGEWNAVSALKAKKARLSERFSNGAKQIFKSPKHLKINSVSPLDLSLQRNNSSSVRMSISDSPRKSRAGSIDITKQVNNRRVSLGGDLILKQLEAVKKDPIDLALEGNSLYILSPENMFRRLIARIALHPAFENFILITIICSSVILALDSPTEDPSQTFSKVLSILDKVTTFIFAFEMLFKLIVHGVINNGPQSYLRSAWNVLDCIIVIISVVSLSFDLSGGNQNVTVLNQLKILRTLRVLRPLRLISKNEGLKLVLNSILAAIPSLINLIFVCLIFFLLFGVVGVNFFKGEFYSCDFTNISEGLRPLVTTKQTCMDYGGDWINSDVNFDNVFQAVSTLFQLATTEGWLDIMYLGIDTAGIDVQPITNNNQAWAIFFILFIIVGSFFVLNLFASVVVDTFNREKDRLGGISFLTKEQQAWINIKLAMVDITPFKQAELPKNKISIRLRQITDKKGFEIFTMMMIFLNVIIFALHWDRQSEDLSIGLDIANYVLLGFFIVEAIAKIIGYGKNYFKNGWNLFDFLIITTSLATLIIDKATTLDDVSLGSSASVIRTFRVGRVFKLINKAKSLRTIFNTIIITLPALANIGGLLLLVLFIYASLGNSLFAYTRMGDAINEDINFQTFGLSFLTLFKMSTGENWNSIFYACSRAQQANYACREIDTFSDFKTYGYNDCGSGPIAVFYFISFQLVFTFILLNLFIAIILEAFNQSNKNENAAITDREYEHFKEVFKKYDSKGRGLIPEQELDFLLQDLKPPLLNPVWKTSAKQRSKFIIQAELPVYEFPHTKLRYYQFHDILLSLSRRVVEQEQNLNELENIPNTVIQLKHIEKQRGKYTQRIPGLLLHQFSSSEIRAGMILVSWAKEKQKQKDVKSKETEGVEDQESSNVPGKSNIVQKSSTAMKDETINKSVLDSPYSFQIPRIQPNHNSKSTMTFKEELEKEFDTIDLNASVNVAKKQNIEMQDRDITKPNSKTTKMHVQRQPIKLKEGIIEELEKIDVVSPINYERKALLLRKESETMLEGLDMNYRTETSPLRSQRTERSSFGNIMGNKNESPRDEEFVSSKEFDSRRVGRPALMNKRFNFRQALNKDYHD